MLEERKNLKPLLAWIENRIDPALGAMIDERYTRTLTCQPVDRPPLVLRCEEMPLGLEPYPYHEAFDDPAKMLFNQLLLRVATNLVVGDDGPLAVRTDHGTVVIASLLGGRWLVKEDMYPWIEPVGGLADVEALLAEPGDLNRGLGAKVQEFLRFYNETLADYPQCRQSVQIALPDLQGPFDTVHELCGSEIYYHLGDEPQRMTRLLSRVADTMIAFARRIRPRTRDRLYPNHICQHGYVTPGTILIRDDSIINISPETYRSLIWPHDEHVLRELGGGSIHFCGDGQHQIDNLLKIEPLVGLDLGQPYLMDMDAIRRKCTPRNVPILNMMVSSEEVLAGNVPGDFRTGVVFTCEVKTLDEGREVTKAYRRTTKTASM